MDVIPSAAVYAPKFTYLWTLGVSRFPEALRKRTKAALFAPAVNLHTFLDHAVVGVNLSVPAVYHGKKLGGIANEVSSPGYQVLDMAECLQAMAA